jgi:DNA/RNA-binding domain of Phe-tRNA-synthetase-like protein
MSALPELRISEEVASRHPGLRAKLLTIDGVRARPLDERLEALKAEVQRRISAERTLEGLRDDPIFRAYRDFLWSVGIDPTKTRPASEALVRRILSGRGLPRVNTVVDSYNLASALSGIPMAAFDADRLSGEVLTMRFSRRGEEFLGIGMDSPRALTGREILVEDGAGPIAIYLYRDAARTMVTESTRRVLLMICGVPGIPEEALDEAGRLAERIIGDYSSLTK